LGLRPDTECLECFRRGFTDYVGRAGLQEEHLEKYMADITDNLCRGMTPPLAGAASWALLRNESRTTSDIFSPEKRIFTGELLSVYDDLRAEFLNTGNPAASALSAATWCNLLDVGQGRSLPGISELTRLFSKPLSADERHLFLNDLGKAESLLILGDNAGETVLDRLFLELSGFSGKRYYMTREKPVMNDALINDARQAGLESEATLISSGTDVPAVIPGLLRGEPLEIFRSAGVILAKGQGNLEGLFGLADPRVYHSFVVKCPVVARATGTETGCAVFRRF